MKKYIYFSFLLVVFSIHGCKKTETPIDVRDSLVGEYVVFYHRFQSYSMTGGIDTLYADSTLFIVSKNMDESMHPGSIIINDTLYLIGETPWHNYSSRITANTTAYYTNQATVSYARNIFNAYFRYPDTLVFFRGAMYPGSGYEENILARRR